MLILRIHLSKLNQLGLNGFAKLKRIEIVFIRLEVYIKSVPLKRFNVNCVTFFEIGLPLENI